MLRKKRLCDGVIWRISSHFRKGRLRGISESKIPLLSPFFKGGDEWERTFQHLLVTIIIKINNIVKMLHHLSIF